MNLLNETAEQVSVYKIDTSIDNLMFPVRQVPLYYKNDIGDEIKKSDFTGVLDVQRNEILYCGKDYQLLDNRRLEPLLSRLYDKGFSLKDTRNYNNRKFEINLISNQEIHIGNEMGNYRMKVINSYDGTQAFKLVFGFYIQVCSNGATIGKGFSYDKKHISSSEFGHELPDIGKHLSEVSKKIQGIKWQSHERIELTEEEIKKMFEKLTERIPEPKVGVSAIKMKLNQMFQEELHLYPDAPKFALMMAATNIATHGHNYGIAPSYQIEMESAVSRTFFN